MEGLIPFIYRAVKERRRRSYSRCSSAGLAAERFGFGFGAAAVDDDDVDVDRLRRGTGRKKADHPAERGSATHRRHRSLEELAGEVGSSAPNWRAGGRSVRIFSCIGGGGA